jgi:hypothetical protein
MSEPIDKDLRESVVKARLARGDVDEIAAQFGVSVDSVFLWTAIHKAQQLLAELKKIKEILWSNNSDIDFLKNEYVRKIMAGSPRYFGKYYAPLRLFRVQRLEPKRMFTKEQGINKNQLGYNPKPGIGRLNQADNPIFYCSVSPDSLVFELECQPGEELVICEWKTLKDIWAFNIYLNDPRNLTPELAELHQSINELFESLFRRKISNNEYHSTIAISEVLFDPIGGLPDNEQAGAIIYRSVAMQSQIDNLAIKPWFADRHLEWVNAVHIRVISISSGVSETKELDFSNEMTDSGKLIWKGRPPKRYWPVNPENLLVFEESEYGEICKDESGKVVLPTLE